MSIVVKAENLNKSFPAGESNIQVLFDINLEIRTGELTMLVGPSGCGKTTLISILSGILSFSSGKITLIDKIINDITDEQKVILRRNNIGFIFQQYNLMSALTVAENAAIPLIASGMKNEEAVIKAKKILEKIGMAEQLEKIPSQISGGQQQRVAIARALVHDPKLVICDEPTAALDAHTGHAVMEILRNIANDSKRAVLIVTHDNRIYHFADRIIEMSDGKIIGDYKAKDFIKKEKL